MAQQANPRKRAAVFDLDGTLVDSMPLVVEMFIHAVVPFRDRPSTEEVFATLGGPLDTCVRNLLGPERASFFPEAKERMLRYEREHVLTMKPFPGARQLLQSLRERGVPVGLWTGRDRWSAEKILGAHGLADFFKATVCGDDLPTHKPDPQGLLRAISLLGADPSDTVFLGDGDADVEGGSAAAVHTVFLHHGRAVSAGVLGLAAEHFPDPASAYAAVLAHF
jgi:HAD superfamily hydrolase (TIGR01509 family)